MKVKEKLNGLNLVCGVNTCTVSLLRYAPAFVSWRKSELQAIHRKTRKLFLIYGALGQFYMRQTEELRSDQCWAWLQNRGLERETESLIVAAQNQGIRTNLVKAKIDKS